MEQESSDQTFSSDQVSLTVRRLPQCKIEFEAQASRPIAEKARKQAIKLIAKEVTIPGFRKGRAPDEIILKRYAAAVDEKWQKAIADLTFKECEKLAKLPVLNGNSPVSFKMKEHSEEGASMTFTFEGEPEIPEISFENLSLETVDRPIIDEEKVGDTIKQILSFFAKFSRVTDRPIQEGDYVLLDVDIIEEEPIKRLFSDTRFEVNDKSMAKWMKDLVMGLAIGQSAEGMSNPDEDASDADKEQLKPRKVKVTVKSVEEAEFPPIDEAFAQRIGADNEADLREKVEKLLNKQADDAANQAKRDQISDALIKKYASVEIPQSIIDKEVQFRFRQLLEDPAFQTRFKSMSKEELKETQENITKQAENAIRLFYLCRKVIADADIQLSTNELQKSHESLLDMMFDKNYAGDLSKQTEEQKALSLSRLMLSKAHDYIIEQLEKKE